MGRSDELGGSIIHNSGGKGSLARRGGGGGGGMEGGRRARCKRPLCFSCFQSRQATQERSRGSTPSPSVWVGCGTHTSHPQNNRATRRKAEEKSSRDRGARKSKDQIESVSMTIQREAVGLAEAATDGCRGLFTSRGLSHPTCCVRSCCCAHVFLYTRLSGNSMSGGHMLRSLKSNHMLLSLARGEQ